MVRAKDKEVEEYVEGKGSYPYIALRIRIHTTNPLIFKRPLIEQ